MESEMSHDNDLKSSVLAELKWEPSVDAGHIGVTARDGIVALKGHVGTYMEKRAAENAAGRVKGVKAVAEEIEVRLFGDSKRGDEEIARAAVDSMMWDSSVPKNAVKITVEKGWVTLTGETDWQFQKEAAQHDVYRLLGVIGVSNNITLKSRVNTTDISDDIDVALNRSWFDPSNIDVSATGGKVHLTGTANSWYERNLAATTAWNAPGATSVVNDITVM
jgi:osmotically-inducible protein OsmY